MKENQFRNKIYWFSFVFSILVVWTHSYNSELFLGKSAAADLVYRMEHLLGDTVAQISVPGFFLISGYLFYRNFAWDRLWQKWNSRIRSVLVPFIVWNSIYYLGYVIGSRLPWVTDVVGKGIVPFDLFAAAEAILHYTYNYVFWYLYQLILLVGLAPVICGLLRNRYLGLAALGCMFAALWGGVVLPVLNLDALIYYSVAAYGALHGRGLVEGWNQKTGLWGLLLFGVGVGIRYLPYPGAATVTAIVLFRLLVPIALWLMVDEKRLPAARPWMTYNFFLYATHFAMVRLINKTGAMVLPSAAWLPIVFYFMMPVVVTFISFWAGAWLRRHLPVVWRLLNGGR